MACTAPLVPSIETILTFSDPALPVPLSSDFAQALTREEGRH